MELDAQVSNSAKRLRGLELVVVTSGRRVGNCEHYLRWADRERTRTLLGDNLTTLPLSPM